MIHPVIKSWSFRGWGLNFIVKINPLSSKRHCFVLVVTDYYTKWTEAVPLKDMIHSRDCIYSGLSHLHKLKWPIYDIVLQSKTWLVCRCFSLFKCIFRLGDMFLGTQALPRNRRAYVDTQNWHDSGFLDNLCMPVRPLIQTGQTGLDKFVKLPIGLDHCVDLIETIEMHI